jgi:hypothetical protein
LHQNLVDACTGYLHIYSRSLLDPFNKPPNRGKIKKQPRERKNNKKGEQTTNKNKNQGEEHKRKKRNKNKKGEQTRRTRTREEDEGDVIWGFLLWTYPKKENSAGRWVPCLLSMLLCM